jgi:hypothetical protein
MRGLVFRIRKSINGLKDLPPFGKSRRRFTKSPTGSLQYLLSKGQGWQEADHEVGQVHRGSYPKRPLGQIHPGDAAQYGPYAQQDKPGCEQEGW